MAIKLVPVKCPECGAMLNIEENRTQAFCSYCGAKVLIHNDNEFTYRHVDVADLERAETDRLIRLKELELYEQKRTEREKGRKKILKVLSLLGIGAIIFFPLSMAFAYIFGNTHPLTNFCYMVALLLLWAIFFIAVYYVISGIVHSGEDKKTLRK